MKFKSFLAAVAICLAAISCTKEEAVCLDGEYTGKLVMTVGKPGEPMDATFTIKDHKNNTLTIISPEFTAMGSMKMPALELKNVKVEETAEGMFNLNAAAFKIDAGGMEMINQKGLTGTVKDGKLSLAFDIKPGAMPMSIDFTFEGEK